MPEPKVAEVISVRRKTKKRRLSKEERKVIWAQPAANAGAGWQSHYKPADPVDYLKENSDD